MGGRLQRRTGCRDRTQKTYTRHSTVRQQSAISAGMQCLILAPHRYEPPERSDVARYADFH